MTFHPISMSPDRAREAGLAEALQPIGESKYGRWLADVAVPGDLQSESLTNSSGDIRLTDSNGSSSIQFLNDMTIRSRSHSILRRILSCRTINLPIVPKKDMEIHQVDILHP
jgi:hypothetical protein